LKNLILEKPYNLLLVAIVFLVALFFVSTTNSLDINMHDTYFVISTKIVIGLFIILCLFFWFIYFATRRFLLIKTVTWIHVLATLVFIVAFFKAISHTLGLYGLPRRYYAFEQLPLQPPNFTPYITVTVIFLTAQLLFIVNIVYGIIKRYKTVKKC
jgi:heme/copper-type cytochrome/quinol oxidase subunit 1